MLLQNQLECVATDTIIMSYFQALFPFKFISFVIKGNTCRYECSFDECPQLHCVLTCDLSACGLGEAANSTLHMVYKVSEEMNLGPRL